MREGLGGFLRSIGSGTQIVRVIKDQRQKATYRQEGENEDVFRT